MIDATLVPGKARLRGYRWAVPRVYSLGPGEPPDYRLPGPPRSHLDTKVADQVLEDAHRGGLPAPAPMRVVPLREALYTALARHGDGANRLLSCARCLSGR